MGAETDPGRENREAGPNPNGREVRTHCPYCALQCGTVLRSGAADIAATASAPVPPASVTPVTITPGTITPVTVTPDAEFPVNRGGLCQKGWTAPELLGVADRLRTPLIRDASGRLVPASYDAALDLVATRLRAVQDSHGPDAVGVFGSGGLTNEKAYLLGKFARLALGTSQIDYNGRFCMAAAAAAGNAAFGLDRGLPFPVSDLGGADTVLLAGANPAETMPPLMRHLDTPRLIVVDPRRTLTAERAAVHLRPVPGSDLPLALGLLHLVVTEGRTDGPYIARRTSGFEDAWRAAAGWWPERVERATGVPVAELRAAVELLAASRRTYILTGRGAEQHSRGTDTVSAFINLALGLGLPGVEGSGFGCLTGQGNGQGGREHGQKADQLPGYRSLTDPAARAHIARVWGVAEAALPGPGRSAYELLDALGTSSGPRALLVMGSNPAVSAPRSTHVAERLDALDLLVVADFVLSETAARADVVLPVTQWAEEDGTMTNLEGRVLRRRALLPPPRGVRTDLELLHDLAVRLGEPADRYPVSARAVFEELRRASEGGRADYSGVTYERLEAGEALYWPCPGSPGRPHPGTPRVFLDRFAHPDGRARFVPVDPGDRAGTADRAYPLHATTGRLLAHYQSGAQTRRVPRLTAAAPEQRLEIHPDTARRHGLAADSYAAVHSAHGTATARVRLVPTLRTDTVFLSFHFPGESNANRLTGPSLDPISRIPEFKVSAVRVEPAAAPEDPPSAPEFSAKSPADTQPEAPCDAPPEAPREAASEALPEAPRDEPSCRPGEAP